MKRRMLVCRRALGASALFVLFSVSALAGGPPWISVEMPGDPTNRSHSGAVMLVRAYSCSQPTPAEVVGRAEGLVNGTRRTIDLTLEPTGTKGVYAVSKQWPSEGTWVLTFNMSVGGQVGTVVTLGPAGGFEPVEYHRQPSSIVRAATVQVLARNTTSEDVETALRAAANGAPATLATGPSPTQPVAYLAGGLGLVSVLFGAAIAYAFRRKGLKVRSQ